MGKGFMHIESDETCVSLKKMPSSIVLDSGFLKVKKSKKIQDLVDFQDYEQVHANGSQSRRS